MAEIASDSMSHADTQVIEQLDRPATTREKYDAARTMTCAEHVDGVVHYRALYDEFECHTYRERVLFTHVVG